MKTTLERSILLILTTFISLGIYAQPKLVGMLVSGPRSNGTIIEYIGGNTFISRVDSIASLSIGTQLLNVTMTEDQRGLLYGLNAGGSGSLISSYQYGVTDTYDLGLQFSYLAYQPSQPTGSLLLASDGLLYGLSAQGGYNNKGCIYSYNTLTDSLTVLKSLQSYVYNSPSYPGSLIQSKDGNLYGVAITNASYLGNSGIFRFNINTGRFTLLYTDSVPSCIVEAGADTFYGISRTSTYTSINRFVVTADTGVYTTLKYLSVQSGDNPIIYASNGLIYGLVRYASSSCTCLHGWLYSYDIHSGAYDTLHVFGTTATDGKEPNGGLMQASDGNLYGITSAGGTHNLGTIFQYNIHTSTYTQEVSLDSSTGYGAAYGCLTEYIPAVHSITHQPSDITVCRGSLASFTAVDSSTMPVSGRWQVSKDHGVTYQDLLGVFHNMYSVATADSMDGYRYRAVFANSDTSQAATLTVHNGDSIHPHFTLIPSASTPHLWYLVNQSAGPVPLSYVWSWGDSTANGIGDTVSHTYDSAGYYHVCVTVSDNLGCSAMYCDSSTFLYKDRSGQMVQLNVVRQIPTGIENNGALRFYLSPNPAQNSFTIHNDYKVDLNVRIVDLMGRLTGEYKINGHEATFDISALSAGVYTIELTDAHREIVQNLRMVKQ